MKSRMGAIGAFLFCLVLGAACGGCAFGDRHVALTYKPTGEVWPKKQGRIAVATFADERPRERKQDVGEVRNGLGMTTANVRIDPKGKDDQNQDIGVWVADALAEELRAAGLEVTRVSATGAASGNYDMVVSGSISKLWVSMYMTYDGTLQAQLRGVKRGASVVDAQVEGDADKMTWFASQNEYEDVLSNVLQNWNRKAVRMILTGL